MTTIMATNKPANAGIKYVSATDGGCVGSGAGVAAGSTMLKVVCLFDGQYPLVPVNDA